MDPELPSLLARTMWRLYATAEMSLLGRVSRALAQGIDAPSWAMRRLADIGPLGAAIQRELGSLETATASEVLAALENAAAAGDGAARRELVRLGVARTDELVLVPLGRPLARGTERFLSSGPLAALAETVVRGITATHPGILRASLDIYRAVIAQASAPVLLGAQTRREAAQDALNSFAKAGIRGFVDRAGRGWDMASYAEMSLRTAAAQAMTTAHGDRLLANGVDLVMVSDAPQECKVCRPWEGKVLALGGDMPPGTVRRRSVISGEQVQVKIAGSLEMARLHGLFHPGCRHSTSAYLPGATRPMGRTADPEGDKARQRLRELERRVRRWKRAEAMAIDPKAAARARAQVRTAQGLIRDHVAKTGLIRQRQREQINAAR